MSEATTPGILATISPHIGETLKNMTQISSRAWSRAKQTTKKPVNDLGYIVTIMLGRNASHGGMNRGNTMLTGNADRYSQLCISAVVSNGARAWEGGVITHQKEASYRGLSMAEQMVMDADVHANELNKNLCYGGPLYSRGVVVSVSYDAGTDISTVTFDGDEGGSYFLSGTESGDASKINMSYFFHHPTTFVEHGDTTDSPFPLIDCPTPTTARFKGDLSGGTAVTALDIPVPAGTADGNSSINKGHTSFEKICGDTGDYFNGNRNTEAMLRGIRHDADGDAVDRAMLEFMDTLYTFKWPQDEAGTTGHVDFISPTQAAKMLFLADPLWRLNDEAYKNFDPKNRFRGWGGREYVKDVYLLPTFWRTILLKEFYHYEQVGWGVWDLDGQKSYAPQASGSRRDALQTHYYSVDNVAHEFPGKCLEIFNADVEGAAVMTDS